MFYKSIDIDKDTNIDIYINIDIDIDIDIACRKKKGTEPGICKAMCSVLSELLGQL